MRAWVGAAIVLLVIGTVVPVFTSGTVAMRVGSAVIAVALLLSAGAWLLQAAKKPKSYRHARRWIALSLITAAISTTIDRVGIQPVPQISPGMTAGGLLLVATVALNVVGLLSYPSKGRDEGRPLRVLMDGLLAAVGVAVVVAALFASRDTRPAASIAIALMSAPMAAVMNLTTASSALPGVPKGARREVGGLAIGTFIVGVYAISQALWTPISGQVHPRPLLTGLGVLGSLIVGWAVIPDLRREQPLSKSTFQTLSRVLPAMPFIPVAVSILSIMYVALGPVEINSTVTVLAALLIACLLLRHAVNSWARIRLNNRLRDREKLFRSLVFGSSDLISLHDATGAIRYGSPSLARATGVAEPKLLGADFASMFHIADRPQLYQAFAELRNGRDAVELTMRLEDGTGQWRWVQSLFKNQLDDPSVQGIICNTRDIHEQHELSAKLAYDVTHDRLTDLGNLDAVRTLLNQQCYSPNGNPVTLVLADLDRFSAINDAFGHEFGDEVLIAASRRLLSCVDDVDSLARLGADEFVAVVKDTDDALAVGERILDALNRPVLVNGELFTVQASVGVARSVDAQNADELLRNGDLAMFAAKSNGRSQMVSYDVSMHETSARSMQINEGIHRALREGAFRLYFQPIVAIPTATMVSAEVLLRWHDEQLGDVYPDEFIPIAESSGLMREIDNWVLNAACEQIVAWRSEGLNPPPLSVNISRQHFDADLPGMVLTALGRHGLTSDSLVIEVTESAVAPDPAAIHRVLDSLHAAGLSVSLDDFGTGQSSLSQLAQLPLDKVKIDRSFVMSSSHDDDALALLRSIVGICKTLSLPVIAEGVEDEIAVGHLATLECEYGQGYHFARPMPASDFGSRLNQAVPSPRVADLDDRRQRQTRLRDATGL